FDFTRNDNAADTFSDTYSIDETLPSFVTTESKWVEKFSLLITFTSMASRNGMFLSFLRARIAVITSEAISNFAIRLSSYDDESGHFDTISASSLERSRIRCQISSVRNGINGCSNFKLSSSNPIAASKVVRSMGCWYAGLIISRNQLQKSSQTSL